MPATVGTSVSEGDPSVRRPDKRRWARPWRAAAHSGSRQRVLCPPATCTARVVQTRCEIEGGIIHLRDRSTKFIVDGPLNSPVLPIRVTPP